MFCQIGHFLKGININNHIQRKHQLTSPYASKETAPIQIDECTSLMLTKNLNINSNRTSLLLRRLDLTNTKRKPAKRTENRATKHPLWCRCIAQLSNISQTNLSSHLNFQKKTFYVRMSKLHPKHQYPITNMMRQIYIYICFPSLSTSSSMLEKFQLNTFSHITDKKNVNTQALQNKTN